MKHYSRLSPLPLIKVAAFTLAFFAVATLADDSVDWLAAPEYNGSVGQGWVWMVTNAPYAALMHN